MMILRRDLFSCQHCGKFAARENKHGIRLPCDGEDLEVHHKIPVASGGSDEPNNLETLCHACHLAAHGRAERKTKTKTPRPEACEWEELQVSNNG
jgi:5-methylcytosine-specific restriction endonuclease McrA